MFEVVLNSAASETEWHVTLDGLWALVSVPSGQILERTIRRLLCGVGCRQRLRDVFGPSTLGNSPPTIPSRYPKLDHRPRVTESNDHPITMEAVRTGITEESTPDSLHDRYCGCVPKIIRQPLRCGGGRDCTTYVRFNAPYPRDEENVEE